MYWKTKISQFIRFCKAPSSRFTTLWPLQVVITLTSVSLFTRLSLPVLFFFHFCLFCFVFVDSKHFAITQCVIASRKTRNAVEFTIFTLTYISTNNGRGPKRLETLPKIWHFFSWFFFLTIFKSLPKCFAADRHFPVNRLCISRIFLEILQQFPGVLFNIRLIANSTLHPQFIRYYFIELYTWFVELTW